MNNFQQSPSIQQEPSFQRSPSVIEETIEFHVTYFDDHRNAVLTEVFDDELSAERFASRQVFLEHEWAAVDAVQVPRRAQTAA